LYVSIGLNRRESSGKNSDCYIYESYKLLRSEQHREDVIQTRVAHGRIYAFLVRLHDLWILLAWIGIVTGLMLNTFYNQSCCELTTVRNPIAPCQSPLTLGLMFLAAIGGGAAMTDERIAMLGFLIVHVFASVLFITALVTPSLLGLTGTGLFNVILSQGIILAITYQFPFAILLSLVGSILGLYVGGKIDR